MFWLAWILLFGTSIEFPVESLSSSEVIHCAGEVGGVKADFAVSCAHFHKLRLAEEELQKETFDLLRHLRELLPAAGREVGLLTYQNGIKTPLSLFLESCQEIASRVPEGTLFIGLHNKSKGLFQDVIRLLEEIASIDTPAVRKTRLFFQAIEHEVHAVNPDLLWGCILHSEAGALARRAIEGMKPEEKAHLQRQLYLFAMTPVLPIPANYGYFTLNLYSRFDFLSIGGYLFGIGGQALANMLLSAHNCRMYFIPCTSTWNKRTFLFIDHSFLGTTYLNALEEQIARWRSHYGLYDGR